MTTNYRQLLGQFLKALFKAGVLFLLLISYLLRDGFSAGARTLAWFCESGETQLRRLEATE